MKLKNIKTISHWLSKVTIVMLLLLLPVLTIAQTPQAAPDPGITQYMYVRVPNDKREEFIKRETTYWAEVVAKAIPKGNITFWALLEKVGGYDLENSSNFLFVNTFKNIDAAGEIWNSAINEVTSSTPEKNETNSMRTVTSIFYLRSHDWKEAAGVYAAKDFKYISMVYHNSSNANSLVELESKHWGPFIKSIMDKKQVSQRGWGNAIVLAPSGDNIKFNSVSYDLYPSLKEALYPTWDSKIVLPQAGLDEINKLELNRRGNAIYRIIKVVN